MSSQSSFYWAMRLLPGERRRAMFTLYTYCRVLDDIADGDCPPATKTVHLDDMRKALARLFETGSTDDATIQALSAIIRRYDLPRCELEAIIDGMAMDVSAPIQAPDLDSLRRYCRHVAGSVGLLAIRIFGRPEAETFATTLGEALQLTNILRDVGEDAARERLYLPYEALHQAGIEDHRPSSVIRHPALPVACAMVADMADVQFQAAQHELSRLGRKGLFPAEVMMATYQHQLQRLRRAGWTDPTRRIARLSRSKRLWIALKVVAAGP